MSRHALNAHDPKLDVIVGWDPPLRTYFVQVIRPAPRWSDADDEMILWRGFGSAAGDEIASISVLRDLMREHAELPDAVERQLMLDKGRDE